MSSTFDQVATIIAETCDIPRDTITPDSHASTIWVSTVSIFWTSRCHHRLRHQLPLEKWTQEVNDGKAHRTNFRPEKSLCPYR